MSRNTILIIAALIVLATLSGCVSPQSPPSPASPVPTITPLPPTPTTAPPPTEIPTQTPEPSPTETQGPTAEPSPTGTPDVPFETVSITTEDGIDIAATLFGEGDRAVILLHMGKGTVARISQKSWHPFARYVAEHGYAALTIDFRGRGQSGGEMVTNLLILDAQAAVAFLQERGFSEIVCVGAGMGGTTCMRLALDGELAGIVILSSSMEAGESNKVTAQDLASLTIPKLYIYGEKDGLGFPAAMQGIYAASAGPKELLVCDNAAHGTELLYSSCGEDVHQHILAILEELR